MLGFIVAGGMGAVVNYALFSHWLSSGLFLPLDSVLRDLGVVIQLGAAITTLISLLFGVFGGTLFVIVWHFLKARVIRFLLSSNVWFLTPKHPLTKLWYMLMLALVGSKNRGVGRYQDYLPSLPVPPLKDTLKKYLNSVRPLLTMEEYQDTSAAVQEFQSTNGNKIQRFLRLRSWWLRNWMADWWLDFIYLRQRTPISFNSNYFAVGSKQVTTPHGLDRAALALYSAADYVDKAWHGKAENFMGGPVAPFCMEGYRYLGYCSRIPGEEIDKLVSYKEERPTHTIVLRRGKFYVMDVFSSKTGRLLSPKMIKKQLEKIVEMAGDEEDTSGVASFTALPRTKWAEVRKRLEENPVNKKILTLIDSSLTVMVLESESVESTDLTAVSQMLFHGNINNRWFDKAIQLIVTPNGSIGANVEHAPLDATVCGQMWEHILSSEQFDEQGHVVDLPNEEKFSGIEGPEQLNWELDGFQENLIESKQKLREMIADSDLLIITPSYGKRVPKKCNLSPDGWFQMSMQLAYYRLYQQFVLTYESATTRLYYRGRTETIRPVSDDSVAFVKSFDDPNVPREDVKKMLKKAIQVQCKYKMEAMRGLGVDRHLFGLYIVAKGLNLDPMPKIFTDKAFNLSFTLSTSQTPVRFSKKWKPELSSSIGGFGTVTEKGYGVSYLVITEDIVNFSIHSKRSCPDTDSRKFADALLKAFDDMRELYSAELGN